jgi:tricorn protease
MRYAPEWSADGTRLAFSDKDGKLYVVTLADTKPVQIADDPRGLIRDYTWSPKGAYRALSMYDPSGARSLHIWSATDAQVHRMTDETFNEEAPSWDPEGEHLYYQSERQCAPQMSQVEWNFAGARMTGLFALTLKKDGKSPFPPPSDEVTLDEKKDEAKPEPGAPEKTPEAKDNAKAEPEKKERPFRIDFDGLASRVTPVPVNADNYRGVVATKGYLLDAKPDAKDKKTVSTKGLMVDRVPAQEWAEIFDEVWRRYRDFFYVANMHGYDWKAIGERYRALLPHVAHRSNLNYVLGEMVAELNVGHAYIEGGDYEIPPRPKVALPGARFELDEKAGRYRIARVLEGQNEEDPYRSPLTEVGVDAKAGDYVLEIDGVELKADDDPYRLLRHKTDPVTLTLNAKPTLEGARRTTYRPITSEESLLYLQFVRAARAKVAQLTKGRAGYIHIPDMGSAGSYESLKWFYPEAVKEGLVVDVRSNGGGNISQWVIERLSRKLLGTRFGRIDSLPSTYPDVVVRLPPRPADPVKTK